MPLWHNSPQLLAIQQKRRTFPNGMTIQHNQPSIQCDMTLLLYVAAHVKLSITGRYASGHAALYHLGPHAASYCLP